MRWSKQEPLNISVCSKVDTATETELNLATLKWREALQGRLDIRFSKLDNFPPYSDLNHQCLVLVNDYMTYANPKYGNLGLTMNIDQPGKLEFLDGDIFILKKEFEKTGAPFSHPHHSKDRMFTYVHELGHLLGLDHHFKKGDKSIMSYDFSLQPTLYDYDVKAIQYLYDQP